MDKYLIGFTHRWLGADMDKWNVKELSVCLRGWNPFDRFLCMSRTYVQKCMQWRKWRNWRKIASCWRLELDAKSGPLEAGDFGENGDFGEIGDFGKIAMHAMAKLAKNHQPLAIWIGCQKWPLGGWRFWRNWRFWQKSPEGWRYMAKYSIWMPKVAPSKWITKEILITVRQQY